jgi:hypothetical protein
MNEIFSMLGAEVFEIAVLKDAHNYSATIQMYTSQLWQISI